MRFLYHKVCIFTILNIFFITQLTSQCAEITASSINGPCTNGSTPCDVCPGAVLTLKAEGANLINNGCVDWYYSDDQNFDPYQNEGTFIACGKITTTFPPFCAVCPTILAMMIDACGPEGPNEFMLLSSGSGFNLNNLQIDFAMQNNQMGNNNNDINIGASPCGWKTPNASLIAMILASANCTAANVIPVGPGESVPPNGLVVVFTSGDEFSNYDFSALCATGQKLYVVQNACNRTVGAFSNGSSSGSRTTTISIAGCSCTNSLTYTCEDLAPAQDGDYVLADGTLGNDGCTAPDVIAPPVMSTSTIADVTLATTEAMCNMGPYYIKGILNPPADPLCPDVYTGTFAFNVVCPEAEAMASSPTCWGGSVNLEANGGDTYKWSGPGGFNSMQQNPVITGLNNLKSGTYTVTVTNAAGCTDVASVQVTVNPDITVSITPANPAFCEGESVTLTGNATGGSGNFDFEWTEPGGGMVNGQTISASVPGTYTLVVTDGEGCTKSASINVIQNPSPDVDITPMPAKVCEGQTKTITANATGGSPAYNYSWSNGMSSAAITVGIGTYNVTVTDAKGCKGFANIEVENYDPIDITFIQNPDVLCNGASATLTANATGGTGTFTSYQWTTPGGPASGSSITVSQAGNYTVTITDNAACTGTAVHTIIINPILNVSINPNPASFCAGGSVDLTANATGGSGSGYLYNWSTPSGNKTGQVVTATLAGAYSVTVTDGEGCTGTAVVNVTENANLSVNILPATPSFCPGSFVNLTATPSGGTTPYSFSWTTPGGTKSGQDIQANIAGNYTVTVSDSKGCTGTATVNVTESPGFPVNITPPNPSICPGGKIDLTAVPGGGNGTFTYAWTTPGGNKTGATVTATVVGTYNVTVTDSGGCSGTAQTTVVENPNLAVSILPAAPTFCPGETVDLTVNAPGNIASYSWTTPGGSKSGSPLTVKTAGNYTVTVTDTGGCSGTATVNVSENPAKTVTISPANPGFCSGSSVELTVNATGNNLVYNWTTPSGTANGNPLIANVAGIYTVTVTEQGACSGTASVQVDEVSGLTVDINPKPASFCNNGSVLLTASSSNGIAPFTYSWSSPAGNGTGMTFNANIAGNYTVTITDSKGCSGSFTIPVVQSNSLIVTFNPVLPGFCPGKTVDISTNTIGGQAPFSYQWSSPLGTSANPVITTGTPGNYKVTVTDSNGCSGLGEVVVDQFSEPLLTLPSAPGFCPGNNVALDVTVNDNTPPYIYTWTTPSGNFNTKTITANIAGNYTISVTNANNCTASQSVNVTEYPAPIAEIIPDPVVFCKNSSATVTANPSGGAAPYTFLWSGPATNTTATNIQINTAGVYTLLVTDAHSCTADYTFPANEQPGLLVSLSTDPQKLCGVAQFNVNANVTGGNPPYTYSWNTPGGTQTGSTISGNESGTYSVTVTDNEACSGVADLLINNKPLNALVTPVDPTCKSPAGGSIALVFDTGIALPANINLNNNSAGQITQTTHTINGLAPGNYQLLVTDAKGCEFQTTVTLAPLPVLHLDLGQDVTINLGDTYTIHPITDFAINNISWTNEQSLNCPDPCINPVAGPVNTTTYKASAYDENGCLAEDELTIYVHIKTTVYVPNSFSPDADGINDKWVIFADNTVKLIKTLHIYDRWGESIMQQENFPPNDPDYGWNGTFRRKPLDPAVFVYYFVVEYENGTTKVFKGDINIISKK